MKNLNLLLVALLSLASACSTAPKHPSAPAAPTAAESTAPRKRVPRPMSPRCAGFCSEIHACAAKADHADLGDLLCEVARCETGDKCSARLDSPGHRYRGAFQFSKRSWRGLCYPIFDRLGMKSCRAPKAAHDLCCSTACSAELISQGGIGNWPVCGPRAQQ